MWQVEVGHVKQRVKSLILNDSLKSSGKQKQVGGGACLITAVSDSQHSLVWHQESKGSAYKEMSTVNKIKVGL